MALKGLRREEPAASGGPGAAAHTVCAVPYAHREYDFYIIATITRFVSSDIGLIPDHSEVGPGQALDPLIQSSEEPPHNLFLGSSPAFCLPDELPCKPSPQTTFPITSQLMETAASSRTKKVLGLETS